MIRNVIGDWGSTRLRLFLIEQGQVAARLDGPGTTALTEPAERVLGRMLSIWLARGPIARITLCGMAGSPGGLAHAPYAPCPVDPALWHRARTRVRVIGLDVEIMPGLSFRTAEGVPEVMRGEETQVFGAMALNPALTRGEHLFALPGTHGKWVNARDGAITGFRTAPTGELFAAITQHTSLLGPEDPAGSSGDEAQFNQGFDRGLTRCHEPVSGALFEARAARMLDGQSRAWARGYVSGLLIGSEAVQFARQDGPVCVIGDQALARLYTRALAHLGVATQSVDGDAAAMAGLQQANALAKGGLAEGNEA
ncbi:MAG: 2-dehydro-3-deoxygalactonokinase [Novosphingobium sp.]|nr:2-dehydro-3-deoxygalactonokinase [Novosphingobium sp.]